MKRAACLLAAGLLAALVARTYADEPIVLRIATQAPTGTSWSRIMEDGAAEVARRTNGRVVFAVYWSGLMGDDRSVVRKMKLGTIDGATLSTLGLSLTARSILVLQLPFFFDSLAEVDHVRAGLSDELTAELDRAGYVLLSWGDLGWVYLFSKGPIRTVEQLRGASMWHWTDEPFLGRLYARLGVQNTPLSFGEVLPSLHTGRVVACNAPLLAAIALQWFGEVRYVSLDAIAYSVGVLVVRRAAWDKLRPDDQAIVREVGQKLGRRLTRSVRRDEVRARSALRKVGLSFVAQSDELRAQLAAAARAEWDALAGRVYPRALLERAIALRDELRAAN